MCNADPNQPRTVELLDSAVIDDEFVLLNGHGWALEKYKTPVYLTFTEGDTQRNSRGELYAPQHKW